MVEFLGLLAGYAKRYGRSNSRLDRFSLWLFATGQDRFMTARLNPRVHREDNVVVYREGCRYWRLSADELRAAVRRG